MKLCQSLTVAFALLSFAAIQAAEIATEKLVYKKIGERELKLLIEKPADWKATDKRPAIVFFFGAVGRRKSRAIQITERVLCDARHGRCPRRISSYPQG